MTMANIFKGTFPGVCLLFLGVLSTAFFLLFLITGIRTKLHTGNAVGMVMSGFLTLVFLFPNKTGDIVCRLWGNGAGRALLIIFASLAVVSVITAVIISAAMIRSMDRRPEKPANVIVLGCRVKENGPSLMLDKRIEAAYEYLSENSDVICIASGGRGDDEPISEAECIRQGLVRRGISPDRIISEDKSVNTYENIRNSLAILDSIGAQRRAVIVTSEFHQLRASMISEKQGLESYSVSSRTYPPLLPSYWIREWFAAAYEWVKKG